MATYVVPQVQVHQDLALVPQAQTNPQPAHISGGHAYLSRYTEASEKALGLLGYYDPAADECFTWPNRPAGAVVDSSYTRVYIDDALLQYFDDPSGSGSTIMTDATYPNRITSDTLAFSSNGTTYPHTSASFKDRGVKIGDVAKVLATVGATTYTLWTYVAGFVGATINDVIAAATADANNQADNTAGAVVATKTAGADNCVDITATSAAAYDGLADGDIEETYTIEVVQASTGGVAESALLLVTSASGNDDVASVTPSAFGVATAIGTRGLTVTWNDAATAACSLSATGDGVSADDFIVGQTWTVACDMTFAAATATSGGDYTGTTDVIYIVEVTKGGLYTDSPEITVTNNKGTDMSGPTIVTGAGVATAVGTLGVTISFDETALNYGDKYYITCTAATTGYNRTLILGHNFDEDVQDNGSTEVSLTLYIKKDIEVSENRASTPGVANWSQTATQICLELGIDAYDSTWTDGGVLEALPVISASTESYGAVYVTYRAWYQTLVGDINSIYDVGQLDTAIAGALHPDNPLKWGVSMAVANSNGVAVRFTAVADPSDSSDWLEVLELLDGREDVYGLVPLTRNSTVLAAFQSHVNSQSSAEMGRWRVAWFSLADVSEAAIVSSATSTDDAEVLAVISDDASTTVTAYTWLTVPGSNGAFVTNGVAAGDTVRAAYTLDAYGATTYSEYLVDAVINEDTLRLVSGPAAPITVAQKIEVWHTRTATEQAAKLALTNGYSNRRIMQVWPDQITDGTYTFEGYHLCAALAGLASGVVPQQGLTNLEISGFTNADRTTLVFNRTQLNTMAAGGVYIVTQDPNTGDIYSRHAVTTGDYDDINEREEQITRNLDNISYFYLDLFSPFIGVSNVTPSMIESLRALGRHGIIALSSRNYVRRLGAQIINGEVTECRAHTILKDRVVMAVSLELPYPLNNVELHLVV